MNELRIVKKFNEDTGAIEYEVQKKDRMLYSFCGDIEYDWRTCKSFYFEPMAEEYKKEYEEFLRDQQDS